MINLQQKDYKCIDLLLEREWTFLFIMMGSSFFDRVIVKFKIPKFENHCLFLNLCIHLKRLLKNRMQSNKFI